jgi:hypothetical protein
MTMPRSKAIRNRSARFITPVSSAPGLTSAASRG